MKNNYSSVGSMMERRLIWQQAAPRSGPGPQDGGDIVVQREQDPQLQRDIDQAARRERLTRETEAIGQVKATETGKVVEAIQSDDLAKTKDATVRYFQMLTDAGADINSAFKAVKDAMSVAGKPELAAYLSVAAGALVFADAPRTPAVEAPAAPQPAAGEAPAQPEQPAPDPLANMEDDAYMVADDMLKTLPPNLQNSLAPTVRKLVEDPAQQAACEGAIAYLKSFPADQRELVLRLFEDPNAYDEFQLDPELKVISDKVVARSNDANVDNVLVELGTAIMTANATPERGSIAPGDRLDMEKNANAALKKIDFTTMTKAEREMQIAQIMMSQGVNVVEKDGKIVATAPNSQMDKIINHLSGVMMWMTALGQKMEDVKEGAKGEAKGKNAEDVEMTPEARKQASQERVRKALETTDAPTLTNQLNQRRAENQARLNGPNGLSERTNELQRMNDEKKVQLAALRNQPPSADVSTQITQMETDVARAKSILNQISTEVRALKNSLQNDNDDLDTLREMRASAPAQPQAAPNATGAAAPEAGVQPASAPEKPFDQTIAELPKGGPWAPSTVVGNNPGLQIRKTADEKVLMRDTRTSEIKIWKENPATGQSEWSSDIGVEGMMKEGEVAIVQELYARGTESQWQSILSSTPNAPQYRMTATNGLVRKTQNDDGTSTYDWAKNDQWLPLDENVANA